MDIVQEAVTKLGHSVREIYRQAYHHDPANETWAKGLYQRSGVITATVTYWCKDQLNSLPDVRQADMFDNSYRHLAGAIR